MTVVFPEILTVVKNIFKTLSLHVMFSVNLETGTKQRHLEFHLKHTSVSVQRQLDHGLGLESFLIKSIH